jgi:choline dehydrogenase-like flavoprotein
MIIDARTLPENTIIETEVCIIGAGPAGLTLAHELSGQNFRVCLLESGGTEPNQEIQSFCEGNITQELSQDLSEARCRQLGGAANLWNDRTGQNHVCARLLPLDAIDFEKRDWLPYSGWPFSKSHLDPFYERAQHLCRLRPFAYDAEDWESNQTPRLPLASDRIKSTVYQFGARNVFTHEIRHEIKQSKNLTTYLNANVLEIETNDAKTINSVRVGCLHGHQFRVGAKIFILAMGGIENARLLLLSNKTQNVGLGNHNDLVGRFFMEHPYLRLGMFTPTNRQLFKSATLYDIHWKNNLLIMGKLTLSEELKRRQQLLNSCLLLFPKPKAYESKAVNSLKSLLASSRKAKISKDTLGHLSNVISGMNDAISFVYGNVFKLPEFSYNPAQGGWSRLKGNYKKFSSFEVRISAEQAPNPNVRVTLSQERDRFGLRKINPISWHWSDIDIHSIVQTEKIFQEEIVRANLGQYCSLTELDKGTRPECVGGNHHMGTTRMHPNPKQGVVDENCRIHGTSNLFVAGSSVFPTGGCANPTLTIIALAIRLAEQVKKMMASNAVTTLQRQLN